MKTITTIGLFIGMLFPIISSHATPGVPLSVSSFNDPNYPQIEPPYSYSYVPPVAADILTQVPETYQPEYNQRYFMSIFGGRFKEVNSSNVGFYDFHQGEDITAKVVSQGISYDTNNPPPIISRCQGVVDKIIDGSESQMEALGTGRSVEIKCNDHFAADPNWGPVYMAYRHLASIDNQMALGKPVAQGAQVGVMGSSGLTDTVHLHFSARREENDQKINVHPMRTFDPQSMPHLLDYLQNAEITQLYHDVNTALFRLSIPYQQTALRAFKVRLLNGTYERVYDFERISAEAGELRDHNDYVAGLSFYAYPYNRGNRSYRRYINAREDIPDSYPASFLRDADQFYPLLNRNLNQTPAYVFDVKVENLPLGYDLSQLQIELIDIYGYGVRAIGDSNAVYPQQIVFSPLLDHHHDAEQAANGSVDLDSSDLEMVNNGSQGDQIVGLHFAELGIPQAANINQAYVQFTADETDDELTDLWINVEDSDNAGEFTATTNNLSLRATNANPVLWKPSAWLETNISDVEHTTPDLANLVQTVVNRPGWNQQSAMNLLISGSGKRIADSADGAAYKAPYLYLEYDTGTAANLAPSVNLDYPIDNSHHTPDAPITLKASAFDNDGTVQQVSFFVNNIAVGSDNTAPYQYAWIPPADGSYIINAIAEDEQQSTSTSVPVSVHISQFQFVTAINSGNHDAEQHQDGSIGRNGSDLELGYDSYVSSNYGLSGWQHVGLRFENLPMFPGAVISRAYLQFTSTKTETEPVALLIEAETDTDPELFSYSAYDISNRSVLALQINWQPEPWLGSNLSGSAQRSPDLANLIQAVVDQPDYEAGQDLVMIIMAAEQQANSARTARSYNGDAAQSPQLLIEYSYTLPPAPNISMTAPLYDQAVTLGDSIQLSANANSELDTVQTVDFYIDQQQVGTDNIAPFSIPWTAQHYGWHEFYAVATDSHGQQTQSEPVILDLYQMQLQTAISHGNDDVEEHENGSIAKKGSDLELGFDDYISSSNGLYGNQMVGLRFDPVNLPKDAIITRTYIQFTAEDDSETDVDLLIYGDVNAPAEEFSYSSFDLSNRMSSTTVVNWQPLPWNLIDEQALPQQTPNLNAVVQELIAAPTWQSGDPLVLIFESLANNSDARKAYTYNNDPDKAPYLLIQYYVNP